MKRKLGTVFSAFALSVVIPITAFGSPFPDIGGNMYEADIDALHSIGVFRGDEIGRANPNHYITREQFTALVARVLGYEKSFAFFGANELALYSDAEDVSAWARYDLNAALSLNVVGNIDGSLSPEALVTINAAVSILGKALSLSPNLSAGSYKSPRKIKDKTLLGYYSALESRGVIDSSVNAGHIMTRAEAANLINAAVGLVVESDTDGGGGSVENIVINTPNVILSDITADTIVITEAVGNGDVTLYDVTVNDRLTIRGGGTNSIRLAGNSRINGSITAASTLSEVRIVNDTDAKIPLVSISSGSAGVVLDGSFGAVNLSEAVSLNAENAAIDVVFSADGFIVGGEFSLAGADTEPSAAPPAPLPLPLPLPPAPAPEIYYPQETPDNGYSDNGTANVASPHLTGLTIGMSEAILANAGATAADAEAGNIYYATISGNAVTDTATIPSGTAGALVSYAFSENGTLPDSYSAALPSISDGGVIFVKVTPPNGAVEYYRINVNVAATVLTEANLASAIIAGKKDIIVTKDITITDDMMVEAGVTLTIDPMKTLNVSSGGSLTVNGTLVIDGALRIEECAAGGVNGTVIVNSGGSYVDGTVSDGWAWFTGSNAGELIYKFGSNASLWSGGYVKYIGSSGIFEITNADGEIRLTEHTVTIPHGSSVTVSKGYNVWRDFDVIVNGAVTVASGVTITADTREPQGVISVGANGSVSSLSDFTLFDGERNAVAGKTYRFGEDGWNRISE